MRVNPEIFRAYHQITIAFLKFDPGKRFNSAAISVKSGMKADIHHEDSRNELVFESLYLKSRTVTVSSLYCLYMSDIAYIYPLYIAYRAHSSF